jgi:acetyl-CoA acetyltransferase
MPHPYAGIAIAGVTNTRQARVLEGYDSFTIALEAVRGLLAGAGIAAREVDGFFGEHSRDLVYALGAGPAHTPFMGLASISAVLEAANAVACGSCSVAVVAGGGAGVYLDRSATAPWTRPANEFVVGYGLYTAAEFALIARRHMDLYGTRPEHLATVAATIRNNGHVNPEAVYFGRGPFTADDILASRMVADPFHLLDCAMTSEGGAALLITSRARARDITASPVYILGAGVDRMGPAYQHPPSWDLRLADDELPNGWVGKRAARRAFASAGLTADEVDVAELYDPFSFEIIRQLEAFGFCEPGEGGDFVMDGGIGPGGRLPVTTDGGLMSFSHGGRGVQQLQRVVRAVQQLSGTSTGNQVARASVALCSNGGAGALYSEVMLLGREPA